MKWWIKKVMFGIHLAKRNMWQHPFRTILISIGFLGISMAILLASNLHDVFYTYYYGGLVETYGDVDLKVSTRDTSHTRFFSITPLASSTVESLTDRIDPFFEFDVFVKISEEAQGYVHLFASSIDHFQAIASDHELFINELLDDEIILTSSYAENNHLVVGDTVVMQTHEEMKTFHIVEIVPDEHMFTGHAMFMNKEVALRMFLSALDPNLATLPSVLLQNFYNVLYVDVKDDVMVTDVIHAFQRQTGFENLSYSETMNETVIYDRVERNTALLGGLLTFVIGSVLLILYTTLQVIFHERTKQRVLIHTLGGSASYAYFILGIELLIEWVIAFVLAVFLSQLSLQLGLRYLSSLENYTIASQHILFAIGISLIIVVCLFVYVMMTNDRQTDMMSIKNSEQIKQQSWVKHLFIIVGVLSIFGLSYISFFQQMLGYQLSIIRLMCSVCLMLVFGPWLLKGITVLFKRFKMKNKTYYHLMILQGKKTFFHYMYVSMMVSWVIFLLIFMMQHLNQRTDAIAHEYDIDFIVTNFVGDTTLIEDEIVQMAGVKDVARVDIYESVEVESLQQSLTYVMSLDTQLYDTYFNIEQLDQAAKQLETYDTFAILLPRSYQVVYGYQMGDSLDLTLNSQMGSQSFVVAGFIEKQGLSLALTNLYMIDENTREHANSLLVKASNNREQLKNNLFDAYSRQMVYVFDVFMAYTQPLIFEMVRVKQFMFGYLWLLMLCFVLMLSNHQTMLRIDRQYDDACMFVLGYDIKTMQKQTWFEGLVIISAIVFSAMVGYILTAFQMKGVFAVFGAYEVIHFNISSLWIGIGANSIILFTLWMLRGLQLPKSTFAKFLKRD